MMSILRFILQVALIAGPAFYLGTVWQRFYGSRQDLKTLTAIRCVLCDKFKPTRPFGSAYICQDCEQTLKEE